MPEVFVIQQRIKRSESPSSWTSTIVEDSTSVMADLGAFEFEADASDCIDKCYENLKASYLKSYNQMLMSTKFSTGQNVFLNPSYNYTWVYNNPQTHVVSLPNGTIHTTTDSDGNPPIFEEWAKQNGMGNYIYEVIPLDFKGWDDEED